MGTALPGNISDTRVPVRVISRDEMNLAEFPITVLSTRCDSSVKTLEFQDTVTSKSGETLKRKWVITGADKFGLPTSSDDEVLLGLIKLTVDDGFADRKVFFTRYELLRILRWTTEGRSYSRLQNALDRLSGVRIKATNAFYDNEAKSHSTRNFGIVDAYEINDGRDSSTKPSFFIWSEEIFKSFQVGFIKKLDLDFYLDLQSAVSKRLYRYLDKHFWYKSRLQMNLFALAHEKIGISRNYQYASSIRQQLDPALEELIQKNVLSRCEYMGKGRNAEIVLYAARAVPRSVQQAISPSQPAPQRPEVVTAAPLEQGVLYDTVRSKLIERGLKAPQIERLLGGKSDEILQKIQAIVAHHDQLLASGSHLISRSPVGFLYRAVENAEIYVLPSDRPGRGRERRPGGVVDVRAGDEAARKRQLSKEEQLKAEFLSARKRELSALRAQVEHELLKKMTEEVQASLGKLKGLISPHHFSEAVEHGVEEKISSLFALPDFKEWQGQKGKMGGS